MSISIFSPIPKELLKSQGNYFSTFQKHSAYRRNSSSYIPGMYISHRTKCLRNTYSVVDNKKQRVKSPQVHHKSMKTKRLRVQRFGENIGMLLGQPYGVNLISPLSTRNRHLHPKEKYTQRFVEKISMLLCRPFVVNVNPPLDTLHYLRWKISVVTSRTITLYPHAWQTTKNSSHGW